MKTKAAVVRETNKLTIEQVNLDPPKPYEILVRMAAAGICHSDLHTYRGELRAQPPLVLGHEGAGIVEKVGAEVANVKPGDRILVDWLPSCNHCPACLCWSKQSLYPAAWYHPPSTSARWHHASQRRMVFRSNIT
ncbi:MAG: alcohol dehydrogenase catalytic domain-containing protein [Caldilineaceae bacterium]